MRATITLGITTSTCPNVLLQKTTDLHMWDHTRQFLNHLHECSNHVWMQRAKHHATETASCKQSQTWINATTKKPTKHTQWKWNGEKTHATTTNNRLANIRWKNHSSETTPRCKDIKTQHEWFVIALELNWRELDNIGENSWWFTNINCNDDNSTENYCETLAWALATIDASQQRSQRLHPTYWQRLMQMTTK